LLPTATVVIAPLSETLEALVPVLVSKTRFADEPVLFAATLIAPVTVMRLLVTNERPEPLARLIAPNARMPLLAPAAVLFAVTERFEPAPVNVIALRVATVVVVAPVALIVIPVLAESGPSSETGKAVELVVLLIEIAPRLEVIALVAVELMPSWEEAVAVCAELFVMVTPVAPETAAVIARAPTPLVESAPVEVFASVTEPVVEVSAELTCRLAADKAAAVEVAVMLRSPNAVIGEVDR